MGKTNISKNYKVHSLERGLDLLELLASSSREMSLSELSKEANFNASTSHRILDALKSRNYVRQNPITSAYSLTFKLFELSNKIGWKKTLRFEALDVLKQLADIAEDSAYLIIKDGDDALCLERIDGNPYIRVLALEKGSRMPLHMGAGPRAILAFLPEMEIDRIINVKGLEAWTANTITNPIQLKTDLNKIREVGYALSLQDVTVGVCAIGCPVRKIDGEVIAAISIAGMASNYTEEKLPPLIDMVRSAAQSLSDRIQK
jgi:DNA-binding IclR family transcriptional regulator